MHCYKVMGTFLRVLNAILPVASDGESAGKLSAPPNTFLEIETKGQLPPSLLGHVIRFV